MWVKVIKAYRDKVTGKTQKPGSNINVSEARAAELAAAPQGPFVEVPPKEE